MGEEWLEPEMKEAMSIKLVNVNEEYSFSRKYIADFRNTIFEWKNKVKGKVKRILKK